MKQIYGIYAIFMHLLSITNVFLVCSVNYSIMEFIHENIKTEIKHGMGEEENIRKYIRTLINCITNTCTNDHNRSENTSYLLIF